MSQAQKRFQFPIRELLAFLFLDIDISMSLTVRPVSTDVRSAMIWCSVNRALRKAIFSWNIISMPEDLKM